MRLEGFLFLTQDRKGTSYTTGTRELQLAEEARVGRQQKAVLSMFDGREKTQGGASPCFPCLVYLLRHSRRLLAISDTKEAK